MNFTAFFICNKRAITATFWERFKFCHLNKRLISIEGEIDLHVIFNPVKPTVILLLFFSFILPSAAQQKEYIFKNFTQEEGLPSNEAYYVFEDSRHFLWFATDLGVVRYNGNKFEQFNLPDNVVFKIREDNKGRIWFFSHKAQLAYFENEKIIQYRYNNIIADRISKINIIEGYVDELENITLTSSLDSNYTISNSGVINATRNYSTSNVSEFDIRPFMKVALFTERVRSSYITADSVYFNLKEKGANLKYAVKFFHTPFAHYGGIKFGKSIFFFAGKAIFKLSPDGTCQVKQMSTEVLCVEVSNSKIIFGSLKGGAVSLDPNRFEIEQNNKILDGYSVTSIKKDNEGGIWFSTLENGIYYVKNKNFSVAFRNEKISRLCNFRDSFLIYSNSNGLHQFSVMKTSTIFEWENYTILDIFYDESNNIYFFGNFVNTPTLIKKDPRKKFNYFYLISSSSEAIKHRDSFFCSVNTSVVLFKSKWEKDRLPYDREYLDNKKEIINKALKLFSDQQGNIWGCYQDGLYKSNQARDTMIQVMPKYPLLKKGVTCIRQMDNGLMVTGIRFGGIALLNDTNIVANITEKDGLLSDKVRYLLPIKDQLWVATAKGISVIKFTSYNPLKFSITNIGKNDGFYNVTINQLIQFKGDIVAATSNGLYFIKDPDELINRKPIPIPFYINSASYYQNDTSAVNSLDLPYAKNRVLLRYSAACFNSAEEVKYQYTFSSADTGWITTSSTELLLENLEPGDYDFRIKAVIPNQNRSSEVQHFHITVQKPWWQNNWFRVAVIMGFIGAGIAFSRYRIKKVQADEERKTALNAKIAELEQTALRAQMNPHFIFNCLTSIQQLIVTGDKTEANEYLVKFARLIRKTLDLSANPFISIKDEMEYLAEYMFLEQLRITGRFEYFIDADNTIDTEKILIPNMMIQPVVENCIRHGIKSLEHRKGIINVYFKMNEGKLTCTVKDNGIGRKNSANESADLIKHKSYGIDIIEKRLKVFEELNDEQMGVEIKDLFNDDASPAGTEVILQLPYKITV